MLSSRHPSDPFHACSIGLKTNADVYHVRSVDGKRYFETGPLRASFVRPDKVTVGDFPELDPFADEEEDDEMEM